MTSSCIFYIAHPINNITFYQSMLISGMLIVCCYVTQEKKEGEIRVLEKRKRK